MGEAAVLPSTGATKTVVHAPRQVLSAEPRAAFVAPMTRELVASMH